MTALNKEIYLKAYPTLLSGSSDCSKCFYGLQLDTYQNGCSHDCKYCWAKAELTKVNLWNNPRPQPISIQHLRELFITVFETDHFTPLRKILERRTPIRLGSLSDPFLSLERQLGVTHEVLKLFAEYKYPSLVLTRSDLIADDKYLKVLDPKLNSVQFSIPSLNPILVKLLEPGAPSAAQRLKALQKLMSVGVWASVRLNPLFPIYPDGYYSEKKPNVINHKFNFFELEMIDIFAAHGCKAILAGFAHLNQETMDYLYRQTGVNLRLFMTDMLREKHADFVYSSQEVRAYYQIISDRARANKMEFSTCYLGLGDSYFWKDQDLWADKDDCCNIKKHVAEFKSDTNDISMSERIQIINPKVNKVKRILIDLNYRLSNQLQKNLWKK